METYLLLANSRITSSSIRRRPTRRSWVTPRVVGIESQCEC